MGKISPVSIKYNINAEIRLSGLAERPDVIGAVFGQTEGLLGDDLELRELQKSGKIGRIEVTLTKKDRKTFGTIIIPSSMGKSETALVGAAIETIDRVGPSESKIRVKSIKDVRQSKRDYVMKRAKVLLRELIESQPDVKEMKLEVSEDVRIGDVEHYGDDKLPGGPDFDTSDDVIIVEGRADVVNLLRYGIKNTVALNGAKLPRSLPDLVKGKNITLFVDGDRGGDLIIKNLTKEINIKLVTKAPDGKEVEELTQKEIITALRGKTKTTTSRTSKTSRPTRDTKPARRTSRRSTVSLPKDTSNLKNLKEEIVGDGAALILDERLQTLGRVPVKELASTLEDIDGAHAIVMDGKTNAAIIKAADSAEIKYIIADKKPTRQTAVQVYSGADL
ncbi:DNA primase [Candidatus Woesearchaeota archaeon]|jgi:DNA primase|nr:DNA primase [Candidatus Woesearchaeota archaeon]